jgi:ligand-binding sensor domain-containing protein/AraC-like DNA-binding protein/CheY-like chemotaxis protein
LRQSNIVFRLFLVVFMGMIVKGTAQVHKSLQEVRMINSFTNAENVHIQQANGDHLWITTPLKVIRYNSAEVEDYNKFRGIPSDIGKQYSATLTDSRGQVWLTGDKGVAVLESGEQDFRFVSSMPGKVYEMLEDPAGQLWLAAENGVFKLNVDSEAKDFGLSRFLSENTQATTSTIFNDEIIFAGPNAVIAINRRSGKFRQLKTSYYENLGFTALLPLGNKLLLATNRKGMFEFDAQLDRFQKIYRLPFDLTRGHITDLLKTNEKLIALTRDNGVFKFDEELKFIKKEESFPKQLFAAQLNDKNLLWLVGNDGLYLKNLSSESIWQLHHDPAKYSSLAGNRLSAMATDSRGHVWFGTSEGLSIWNPETDRYSHIKNLNYKKARQNPDKITSIAANGKYVWVATSEDGVYKININTLLRAHYAPTALYKTEVLEANALFIDSSENTWIGGETGYLTRISTSNEIKTFPLKEVQAIAELGPRKLIVATRNRVHSIDPVSGRISDLDKLTASETMHYYAINQLYITQEGIGLFATEGTGLIAYDFETAALEIFDEDFGLPSNNVEGVIVDDENYWISTDEGLASYDPNEKNLRVFSELNGLTTSELTTGFTKMTNGSLVLGTANGVNIFKPKSMLAQRELKPEVEFRTLMQASVRNEKQRRISLLSGSIIEIKENTGFQVAFQGLSFWTPDELLYSWRMQGIEDEWSKPSKVNSASYASLPPGNYIFEVRSKLPNSSWSEVKQIPVEVAAVSGGIGVVYLFMGIGIIAAVIIFAYVFVLRSRNADRQAKDELRAKLQQEFQKPVESAVQSLSKISASKDADSHEDLQRYAARFDDLFNQILNFNYEESVYEISSIKLDAHLPEVVSEIEPVYKLKDLDLIINNHWGEEPFYYNLEMLDKIFFSLISGSTGYSIKNGKIILNLIRTGAGDLKVQITDTGKGIPAQDIKVLEKKRSLDQRMKFRDKSGLRYILKAMELINKAGGSFNFETQSNEGSTYTAVLKNRQEDYRRVPQRAAGILQSKNVQKAMAESLPKEIENISGSKILIIDSETSSRELLANSIGQHCQVYQAATAEEGIEKASMIFPDIIIAASMLSDMNTIQLSKMLRRNLGLNHINIFMITSEGQQFDAEHVAEITELISEPLNMTLLMKKIASTLKSQQEFREDFIKSHLQSGQLAYRSERDRKFIQESKQTILENIEKDNFSVHDLSASLGISKNTLFMKLKSLVNLSPQEFIEFVHAEYGRELLNDGDFNTMEVAYKAGFSSPKRLQESLKKFYGKDYNSIVKR